MAAKSQSLTGAQRRTRAALLTAAADLLRAGEFPSVARAAEFADVSRRTAYRYFPTQDQLLTEAALESLGPGIEAAFANDDDPETRLEAAVRAMMLQASENERLLRTMIRLTIEREPDGGAESRPAARGSRRVAWLENALSPVQSRLSKADFSRLVSSICLVVGTEALIILRDIRALDQAGAVDVSVWAAKALLRAALTEAETPAAGRARRALR